MKCNLKEIRYIKFILTRCKIRYKASTWNSNKSFAEGVKLIFTKYKWCFNNTLTCQNRSSRHIQRRSNFLEMISWTLMCSNLTRLTRIIKSLLCLKNDLTQKVTWKIIRLEIKRYVPVCTQISVSSTSIYLFLILVIWVDKWLRGNGNWVFVRRKWK